MLHVTILGGCLVLVGLRVDVGIGGKVEFIGVSVGFGVGVNWKGKVG